MGKHLIAQRVGSRVQKRLLRLGGGDIGVDRHPATLRQGRAFDRDGATVRPRTFHVVRTERARLGHAFGHEGVDVGDPAVFAGLRQMSDGLLERGAWGAEPVRQAEHLLEGRVADRESQVGIVDGEGLGDQVEPGCRHRLGLVVAEGHGHR